jgi:hypothetical protein
MSRSLFPFCGAVTDGGEVTVCSVLCPVQGCHVFLLLDSGYSHAEILFVHKQSLTENTTCLCDLQCNSSDPSFLCGSCNMISCLNFIASNARMSVNNESESLCKEGIML